MSNVIPPGGGGPKVPKPPTNDIPTIDPKTIAADKSGAPVPKFNQGNANTDGKLNTLS